MVRKIMHDELLLVQKAEPATLKDLLIAQYLLDSLTANPPLRKVSATIMGEF